MSSLGEGQWIGKGFLVLIKILADLKNLSPFRLFAGSLYLRLELHLSSRPWPSYPLPDQILFDATMF